MQQNNKMKGEDLANIWMIRLCEKRNERIAFLAHHDSCSTLLRF